MREYWRNLSEPAQIRLAGIGMLLAVAILLFGGVIIIFGFAELLNLLILLAWAAAVIGVLLGVIFGILFIIKAGDGYNWEKLKYYLK